MRELHLLVCTRYGLSEKCTTIAPVIWYRRPPSVSGGGAAAVGRWAPVRPGEWRLGGAHNRARRARRLQRLAQAVVAMITINPSIQFVAQLACTTQLNSFTEALGLINTSCSPAQVRKMMQSCALALLFVFAWPVATATQQAFQPPPHPLGPHSTAPERVQALHDYRFDNRDKRCDEIAEPWQFYACPKRAIEEGAKVGKQAEIDFYPDRDEARWAAVGIRRPTLTAQQ